MDILDELLILSEKQGQNHKASDTLYDTVPMCQYKIWTNEEVEELADMYDRGCNLKEMCNEMFRTPRGIIAKLKRIGKIKGRNEILMRE